jgi:hypothetical protein
MVLSLLLFVYVLVVTSYDNGFKLLRTRALFFLFLFLIHFCLFGSFDGLSALEAFLFVGPNYLNFFFNTNLNGDHLFLS